MKRTLCFILAAVMAVSVGCGSGAVDEVTSGETTTENTSGQETERKPDLPDKKWNGENINFLVRGEKAEPTNFSHEIFASEENGDVINDAVFRRNIAVQEKFDVVITETADNDSVETVRSCVLADDDSYDVVMIRPNRVVTLASEGLLYDLYSVPYLDMTAPWWNQNAVENLTINGKLFFATGDINIMDNNATWAMMFNKRLFDEYGLDYPYESVKNGSWTLDNYIKIAMTGGNDLDGNGEMNEFDQYGLITSSENTFPLLVASGERIAVRDKNGNISIEPDLEKIHGTLDKLVKLISDKSVTLYADDYFGKSYSNVWSQVMRASFRDGRGLTYISGILSTTYLRDMADDFGIIPLPKADESQSEYYTWMNLNNSSTLAIPVSNHNTEMTGMVVEALAYGSVSTLTPAYYETTLSGKVARDDDSIAMLDIILDSVVFDMANMFNVGKINQIFSKGIQSGENTFMSDYDSIKTAVIEEFEKVMNEYGKNNSR